MSTISITLSVSISSTMQLSVSLITYFNHILQLHNALMRLTQLTKKRRSLLPKLFFLVFELLL